MIPKHELMPLLAMSGPDLIKEAARRGIKRGPSTQLRQAIAEDMLERETPPKEACAALFERILVAGHEASAQANDAACELALLEYEATTRGGVGAANADDRAQKQLRLKALEDEQRSLHAFSAGIHDAKHALGLSRAPCNNCGDEGTPSVACTQCPALACASCLADGIMAHEGADPDAAAVCFQCGVHLSRAAVAIALARTYPLALDKYVSLPARAEAFKAHIEYVKRTKRKQHAPLSELIADAVTEPLACANCDTPVVLGLACMHMTCERCDFQMCGFCLEPHATCSSENCVLNPHSGEEENESANKRKSMMVLRAYRVARLLAGHSAAEREEALRLAAPAMDAAAEPGVGAYVVDDPWLFREARRVGADDYVTPILRAVLQEEYGGPGGANKPPVLLHRVRCGDVVTLVGVVDGGFALLESYLVDVDAWDEDVEAVALRHAGKRGVVVALDSTMVSVKMLPSGDVLGVHWDAVSATQPLRDAVVGARRVPVPANSRLAKWDFVKISDGAQAVCEAGPKGWHPGHAAFLGEWALVTGMHPDGCFSTRLRYDTYHFPVACAEERVQVIVL